MTTIAAIIPAYNAARYIARAVASVRGQTRPVDAIVVVDDGSKDSTRTVAESLGHDIRLVVQENAGPSAARNRGAAQVSADYIAFLDADDEWLPETIAALADVLDRLPDVALATADMSAVDDAGGLIFPSWFARHGLADAVAGWASSPVPNPVAALMRKNFVATSVVLVRSAVFRALGGFRTDLRYGEDLELWARVAARHPIVCLPQRLGLRRSHGSNTTKATEALLLDLVRMSEVVRAWGGALLRAQGFDADDMVARARTDLGYWYFSVGRRGEARSVLLAAVRERAIPRALRYLALSCLPGAALNGLRRCKETLHG